MSTPKRFWKEGNPMFQTHFLSDQQKREERE